MKKIVMFLAIMMGASALIQPVTLSTVEATTVKKAEAEKSIHQYSKSEMTKWINENSKKGDLQRLGKYKIVNVDFKTLAESNHDLRYPFKYWDETSKIQKHYIGSSVGFMDTYYNRNYKTIGKKFINELRYYHKIGYKYNGTYYSDKNLGKYFKKLVDETKKEKRISESIFVTDVSMYYEHDSNAALLVDNGERIRGTQYIRYTSGSKLPKGVKLNKWYKRDVEVEVENTSWDMKVITWDTSTYTFVKEVPLTKWIEVKK
ncbi:hypothetical protein SM124_13245 [Bacillus sp. 31A1R]|uniref:Uncharacterized protein n=1 Tax=Robertmurraya mangrovi TaxID=3098077 RepID=A0ABU5IZV8_9BACI|nr:hypothetical protein [Bacillus sp. 31A1R]MDZ5472698.1 hypothetical protein [Bacillus sp. 31A1R]